MSILAGYFQDRNGENKSIVDEIKDKVSIPLYFERVILPARGSYYANYGADFVGTNRTVCPLHDEDTPSFFYREELGTYKCFGCGKSGDVISLHQEFTKVETGNDVSFREALEFLKKVFIDKNDISAEDVVKTKEPLDQMKLTYMNTMYARAFNTILDDKSRTSEEKTKSLYEVMALRQYAYTEGNDVLESVADQLRDYAR